MECLHGYWRTLPNYNPLTVSLEPGQDLKAQAMALLNAGDAREQEKDDLTPDSMDSGNSLSQEELDELEADPDADAEGEEDEGSPTPSQVSAHHFRIVILSLIHAEAHAS